MSQCVGCGRDVGVYQRFHIRLSDAAAAARQVCGGPLCPDCFDAVSDALAARERDADPRVEVDR